MKDEIKEGMRFEEGMKINLEDIKIGINQYINLEDIIIGQEAITPSGIGKVCDIRGTKIYIRLYIAEIELFFHYEDVKIIPLPESLRIKDSKKIKNKIHNSRISNCMKKLTYEQVRNNINNLLKKNGHKLDEHHPYYITRSECIIIGLVNSINECIEGSKKNENV